VWVFLGEEVEDPWGDWTIDNPWESSEGRWVVADDVDAQQLAARLREIGVRTRGVLASTALDTVAPLSTRFEEDPPDLRWICFHVLQEYARHAGHLDIVVELS
jgi:hypothetical protein